MTIGRLNSNTQRIKRESDSFICESVLGLKRKETNQIEVQRSSPQKNTAKYRPIVPEHFSSVSHFRTKSIIDSDLDSISQPKYPSKEALKSTCYINE